MLLIREDGPDAVPTHLHCLRLGTVWLEGGHRCNLLRAFWLALMVLGAYLVCG